MVNLEAKRTSGELEQFTKKERLLIDREIVKLDRLYGGLRDLTKIPDAIFVVDVKKEETACREAQRREVPVVAICDTNANLDLVTHPIPGNDDATKSIKILIQTIADAIVEGKGGVIEKEVVDVSGETEETKVAEEPREKVKKVKKAKKETPPSPKATEGKTKAKKTQKKAKSKKETEK